MKKAYLLLAVLGMAVTLPAQSSSPGNHPSGTYDADLAKQGNQLVGTDAEGLLDRAEKTQAELLAERAQALAQAAQASTPEEKLKIMQALAAAQKDRRAQLAADLAKVGDALRARREKRKLERQGGK